MPSKNNHLSTAIDNRELAVSLLGTEKRSLAWATTISFYAALHLVEAALAESGQHFDDHSTRNFHLKKTKKLQNIWKHYKPLYDHSLKARYLMTDGDSAENLIDQHLGEAGIRDKIIGHHLRQIEKSVCKILKVDSVFE